MRAKYAVESEASRSESGGGAAGGSDGSSDARYSRAAPRNALSTGGFNGGEAMMVVYGVQAWLCWSIYRY